MRKCIRTGGPQEPVNRQLHASLCAYAASEAFRPTVAFTVGDLAKVGAQ